MMNLTKRGLPNVVEINGNPYSIYTDFRLWLRFEIAVSRMKPSDTIEIGYLFKNEKPEHCNLEELFAFSRPYSPLPRQMHHSDAIIVDYEIDSDYIYSAFMSQYGIDLVDVKELHWHKFLALFKGLKDDEIICKIMAYRSYQPLDAKKDTYAELKYAWEIEYITEEQEAETEKFSNYFD